MGIWNIRSKYKRQSIVFLYFIILSFHFLFSPSIKKKKFFWSSKIKSDKKCFFLKNLSVILLNRNSNWYIMQPIVIYLNNSKNNSIIITKNAIFYEICVFLVLKTFSIYVLYIEFFVCMTFWIEIIQISH